MTDNHADVVIDFAASANELQTEETRKLLDTVKDLRLLNLNSIVELPQIIVCGDQSSGKSSVLEGITEVPFERCDTLCTRFATEIVLCRGDTEKIRARIIADDSHLSLEQLSKLRDFDHSFHDFTQLPKAMLEATKLMELPDLKRHAEDSKTKTGLHAFSKHVLHIEISGPDRPSLTVVDLPGYIQSPTSFQTKQDVTYVKQLVNNYMKHERTIVLAVIAANNNAANQVVLSEVKKADPKGMRTMGIITKLDFLDGEPGARQQMLDLAQNKDKQNQFGLGWHLVKNRANKNKHISFADRNDQEKALFEQGEFSIIMPSRKGIASLRRNLAKLDNEALKRELPKVRDAVETLRVQKIERLSQIGEKLLSPQDQRQQLMTIARHYEKIVEEGLDGLYRDEFYQKHTQVDLGDQDVEVVDTNLRAKARRYEVQFGTQMRKYGHRFDFPQMEDALVGNLRGGRDSHKLWPEYEIAGTTQNRMDRIHAIKWVERWLVQTRGREMPGEFDASLLTRLFREQSGRWEQLATDHLQQVDELCSRFLETVVEHVFRDTVGFKIQQFIDNSLDERCQKAKDELKRIMKIVNQPVATYDPHFGAKVARMQALRSKTVDLVDQTEAPLLNAATPYPAGGWFGIKQEATPSPRSTMKEMDEDRISAHRALDALLAYYETEVEYFIKAVLKQVIEQNLLEGLAEATLSPLRVGTMSDEEIESLMAEPEDLAEERQQLEHQIGKLTEAKDRLKNVDYSYKRRAEDPAAGGALPTSKRAARRGRC